MNPQNVGLTLNHHVKIKINRLTKYHLNELKVGGDVRMTFIQISQFKGAQGIEKDKFRNIIEHY